MISQRKLAEILNLTQSAVSAALRDGGTGTSKVAPETREKVLEAAKKYGYRPNRYASVRRSGKSNLIAILHGTLSLDWISKIQAVCEEIEAAGYTPWTIDMRRFKGGDEGVFDAIMQSKVEGVVAGPYSARMDLSPYTKANIPIVSFIGRFPRGEGSLPYVGPNKVDGFYETTRHLVEQGCRRISICGGIYSSIPTHSGNAYHATANQAIQGMEQYFADARLSYLIDPVIYLDREVNTKGMDEFQIGKLLGEKALKNRPDALIFTNDSRALGGMSACREAGMRVPHDICVTGFNNEAYGIYNWIPITTVAQPIKEMAKDAVTILMERIQNPSEAPGTQRFHSCTLIPRESSLRSLVVDEEDECPEPTFPVMSSN